MDTKIQEMLAKGQQIVKTANETIEALRNENAKLVADKQNFTGSVKAAAEMSKDIVQLLVKSGFINASQVDKAMDGMKDPVKVAGQLKLVLEKIQAPAVGTLGSESTVEVKSGSAADADRRYLEITGQ